MLSVIVPARNEEACLGACLKSLFRQSGVEFEIIVVDDASTDRTVEVARGFAGIHVVESRPLPEGWGGKSNAAWTGAQHARGEWLLFTDADTVHKPGSLASSLAEAREHKAALLSYSPEQELQGLVQMAVMPVIFAELACTYRAIEVCDPASSSAAANGQYLLIRREAYDAVGGHAAVASSLLEDVELASAVKQSGRRLRFRYGGDAVRTRMYRSFGQMVEGWTKNLALLFRNPVRLAVLRTTEFLASAGAVTVALVALLLGSREVAAVAGAIALPT
jgi:glycosyltransferase involved in cell wall biosynthesis